MVSSFIEPDYVCYHNWVESKIEETITGFGKNACPGAIHNSIL